MNQANVSNHTTRKNHESENGAICPVRVMLRIKPDNSEHPLIVKCGDGKTVMVRSHIKKCGSGVMEQSERLYTVDEVCDQDCSQADVFAKIGFDLADRVLEGYNSTILAYGQTGSVM